MKNKFRLCDTTTSLVRNLCQSLSHFKGPIFSRCCRLPTRTSF
uniref:Uncharacterized protein n=1 Tax=Rhizophora mucronata TaxID=61149 RepID=A0A2P2J1R7_RHIMU